MATSTVERENTLGGTPDSGVLLRVADLRVRYQQAARSVQAVRGVSFQVNRGEVFGIAGESGCGKSSVARALLGLDMSSPVWAVSGNVVFDGRAIRELPTRTRRRLLGTEIGSVFQDPVESLNPAKSVGAHLTEGLRYHRSVPKKVARLRALELLQEVGISDPYRQIDSYPHQLSGGMAQRVAIAMALACDPKMLIADEPTTALDVTTQRQILDLMAQLASDRHMTTLIISHDLNVLAERADTLAIMYRGRMVEIGDSRGVLERPRHPYTKGLLASTLRLDTDPDIPLPTIQGDPSLPVSRGCTFHPRCPRSSAECELVDPSLAPDLDSAREVACINPIPYGTGPTSPARSTPTQDDLGG